MHTDFRTLVTKAFTREFFLDLEDRLRAEAVKAHEMVRERSGLDKKRMRELEGQARFRMMEHGFEEVCALYSGGLLDGGVLPGTDLKVFQPFVRFSGDDAGLGVILGLAAMPEKNALPTKNKSRLAGVTLNYSLSPRLDFGGPEIKIGDVFALLLVSRSREKAGTIEELAIGIVDSSYESFLYYQPFEMLAAEFAPPAGDRDQPQATPAVSVSLKKTMKPFAAPEQGDGGADEAGSQNS